MAAASLGLAAGCAHADDAGAQSKVTIEGIVEGDLVSGQIAVTASVAGLGEARGVEFFVDRTPVESTPGDPFATIIDTTHFAEGHAIISAVAVGGPASPRADVGVTFDNSGPIIELLTPTETDLILGDEQITLRFEVTDASPVSDVRVSANGVTLPISGPPYEASFDLDALGLTADDLPTDLVVVVTANDAVMQQTQTTYAKSLSSRLAWSFSTLGEVWAPPVFGADGSVYLGSRDGKLYAVDGSGGELWRYDTGAEIALSPALDDSSGEMLIYLSSGSTVQVLNASGEQAQAPYDTGGTVGTKPVIGASHAYVGTFDGRLLALNLSDNSLAWSFSAGDAVQSAPLVIDDNLVVFGSDDRWVYAVDTAGQLQWQTETGGPIWSDVSRTAAGDLLVGSNDGYLYELGSGGPKLWEFKARGQLWGAATEGPDGSIYVTSTFRRLYALDGAGQQKWELEASGFAYATPAVAGNGEVFVGATDGIVHALDSDGTQQWIYDIGSEIIGAPRLSPDDSLVVIGSTDRHLYALRTGVPGDCGAQDPDCGGTGDGDGGSSVGGADAVATGNLARSHDDQGAMVDADGLYGVLSCSSSAGHKSAPEGLLVLLLGLGMTVLSRAAAAAERRACLSSALRAARRQRRQRSITRSARSTKSRSKQLRTGPSPRAMPRPADAVGGQIWSATGETIVGRRVGL